MKIEKIYYDAEDGVELFGLLHTPDENKGEEIVISTHGMGSNCFKKRDDIIAKKLTSNGIAYFTYNNRGYGLVNSANKRGEKFLQGTVFEDVQESYYDIVATIKIIIAKGYKNIHLQGHSLGATKTVYTYNKLIENDDELLKNIKSIILLSLVDVSEVMHFLVSSNKTINVPEIALQKEQIGDSDYIIDTQTPFLPLVSSKTFLKYYRDNSQIDFAKYTTDNYDFKILNSIKVPIFMRWGNVNELISIPADKLVKLINERLQSNKKNIGYIEGATHNYTGKEDILAEEIMNFFKIKF